MKKVALFSATVAMLVLSGCSSKEPAIDKAANANASVGTNANAAGNVKTDSNAAAASTANVDTAKAEVVSILFDYNKYNIRSDMESVMKTNSELLKDKHIKLEGNCDEFGSDEYNYALGLKRAQSVKAALVENGIKGDAIAMTSLGETNPVCAEKTQACWAKNRRVDFK